MLQRQRSNTFPLDQAAGAALVQAAGSSSSGRGSPAQPSSPEAPRSSTEVQRPQVAFAIDALPLRPPRCGSASSS